MLLGHVVKLDPLAMFLNCLGESSLSYRSLPTWLDLVPHGLHWLLMLEVERVRDSDVVVGMVVVVVSYRVSSFQLQALTSYTRLLQVLESFILLSCSNSRDFNSQVRAVVHARDERVVPSRRAVFLNGIC